MVSVIAKVVEGAHNRFLDSLGINNKVKSVNKIENFKKLDNTFVSLNEVSYAIKITVLYLILNLSNSW